MSDEMYQIGIDLGLPEWVISAIGVISYEQGHSAGQQEVDNIAQEMMGIFVNYYDNRDNPRYKRVIQ